MQDNVHGYLLFASNIVLVDETKRVNKLVCALYLLN